MKDRALNMDPGRIALPSLRTNGRILLHKTTGPGPKKLYQKEKRSARRIFSPVRRFSPYFTELSTVVISIAKPHFLSIVNVDKWFFRKFKFPENEWFGKSVYYVLKKK